MIEFHDVYTTTGASDVLWVLMAEREADMNISHQEMPSREAHEQFVRGRFFPVWYLVAEGNEWLGYVSLTQRNEIGIVLFKEHQGKGFGKRILREFMMKIQPMPAIPGVRQGSFVANINPKNSASIALFRKMGFKLIQNTYKL